MLMRLTKSLNIIWGSGSSMNAIFLNPRTYKGEGGGGGWLPSRQQGFFKILKGRFTLKG